MPGASTTRSVVVVSMLVVASVVGLAGQAGAAGVTTHRWMAETALDLLPDGDMKALLTANLASFQTGTAFPDNGYLGSNTYGETAHWQRYHDALIDAIRARPDCGDLTDAHGPCAELIAFALGVAAHGVGDEVWDWLFEPYGPDLDEYWTGVPTANDGGAETQMDLVAIGLYGVARPLSAPVPDEDLVAQALGTAGQPGVSTDEFALLDSVGLLWDIEKGWSDAHLDEVLAAMPWMSDNLQTAPGGVDFAAVAIAGYWESLWGRLLGDQPATRVSITYPAPGQTGVPATGWDRASFQPGSSPGRGGAATRIAAVLTSARPYTGASGGLPVTNDLPADSMTITDLSTGEPVPLKSGYPRSVPYSAHGGEHTIGTQPAENLDECTWYRVDVSVTAPVLDARGLAVTPHSWQFRTECDDPDPSETTTTTPGPSLTAPTNPGPSPTAPTTAPPTSAPPVTVPPATAPPTTVVPTTTDPGTGPATVDAERAERPDRPGRWAPPARPRGHDPTYAG